MSETDLTAASEVVLLREENRRLWALLEGGHDVRWYVEHGLTYTVLADKLAQAQDTIDALSERNERLGHLVDQLGRFLRGNVPVYLGSDNFQCRVCGECEGRHTPVCEWGQIEEVIREYELRTERYRGDGRHGPVGRAL